MRTFAFGDIHGCLDALTTLWNLVQPTSDDLLIFLGDYVDRGPRSKQVIDFLLEKQATYQIHFLLGNHEEKLLLSRIYPFEFDAWIQFWDASETMDSYHTREIEDIPATHWEFFRKCRPYFETETHIFIHASVEPDIPIEEQQAYTLVHKKLADLGPHCSGKTIVCGHTAQKNHLPLNLGHTIAIDTDAGRGGWITCLHVESAHYWQANEAGETRQGSSSHHL